MKEMAKTYARRLATTVLALACLTVGSQVDHVGAVDLTPTTGAVFQLDDAQATQR